MRREAEKEGKKIKQQNAKLRNNVIFGKLIENPMHQANVKIVTTRKQYLKLSFRPTFHREKQFRNGEIAIENEKCRINLNKPISILNLSKDLMQDFHYSYIKNKCGNKPEMSLTGTDNLMCKIETENVCEDLYKDKELFDFSNYSKDSKYYSGATNLIVGKIKEETSGLPIKGFAGLKSKMNIFITEDKYEYEKVKGINENAVEYELNYKDCKSVLLNGSYIYMIKENHI